MKFPNRFAGTCRKCSTRVEVGAGTCEKIDGKWAVECNNRTACAVRVLAPKPATAATAPAETVGELSGIMRLFERAKRHLKFPAIVLSVPALGDFPIRVHVAGERAKEPGSVTVLAAERDGTGERAWLGRISLDGTFRAARNAGPEILARLRDFAARPAEVAAEHGRLTGRCCFCNRALEDERSTAVGYGPVCADHYDLPWGSDRHSFEAAA